MQPTRCSPACPAGRHRKLTGLPAASTQHRANKSSRLIGLEPATRPYQRLISPPRRRKTGHPIFGPNTKRCGAEPHGLRTDIPMNQANQTKARILPMRRLALLATTVAGLAVGGFLVSPTLSPYAPMAQAQKAPTSRTAAPASCRPGATSCASTAGSSRSAPPTGRAASRRWAGGPSCAATSAKSC